MLPTPRASAGEQRQTRRSPSQHAGRHGRSLAAEIGELACPRPQPPARLLPTPRASDGTKGSPNQCYSNGLSLASTAARIKLLPTPSACDTGTPGRRAGIGFRPPLSQALLPLTESVPQPREQPGR